MPNDLTAGAIQSRILQYASLKHELKIASPQQHKLTTLNVVLSDTEGTVKIAIKEVHEPNSLLPPTVDETFFEVETSSLEAVLAEIPKIDAINLDAKGAAPLIFHELQNILKQNPKITMYIVFNSTDFDRSGSDPKKFIYELLKSGFSLATMNTRGKVTAISEAELLGGVTVKLVCRKIGKLSQHPQLVSATQQPINYELYSDQPNHNQAIDAVDNTDIKETVGQNLTTLEPTAASNKGTIQPAKLTANTDKFKLALTLSGIAPHKEILKTQDAELETPKNARMQEEQEQYLYQPGVEVTVEDNSITIQLSDETFLQETNSLSDEAFLQAAYRTYLNREPDELGKQSYCQYLGGDKSKRLHIIDAFRQSPEFKLLKEFDYSKYPQRLNLGCGFDIKLGYLNVDLHSGHNPDLVADIRCLNMLPSGFYEEIIAQDCLEHLPRAETQLTIKEWARLLKIGGILQLRVPSVIDLLELFKLEVYQTVELQEKLIQCLFGTQAYNGDWHFTGFTKILLTNYLEVAGFAKIEFKLIDAWLFDVTAEKVG